jgi:hypothetical protein
MFKTRRLVMLLGILGLILSGCKDNSKNKNTADRDSSSNTEKKMDAYATIRLDDGRTFEVQTSRPEGNSSSSNSIGIKFMDYKILVRLNLKNTEPIKDKTYRTPEVKLSIYSVSKKSQFDRKYRSYWNESEDGKVGEAKVTITSISKTHAEGTFTGTAYSKSHRKATIEGKFMIKREMR